MLDKESRKVLKKLYRCEQLSIDEINSMTYTPEEYATNKHVSTLLRNGFIEKFQEDEQNPKNELKTKTTYCKITLAGMAYIEGERRGFLNFWVPYIITTVVALAGLLVAIAGLLQSGQSFENTGTQCPFRIHIQIDVHGISDK